MVCQEEGLPAYLLIPLFCIVLAAIAIYRIKMFILERKYQEEL